MQQGTLVVLKCFKGMKDNKKMCGVIEHGQFNPFYFLFLVKSKMYTLLSYDGWGSLPENESLNSCSEYWF